MVGSVVRGWLGLGDAGRVIGWRAAVVGVGVVVGCVGLGDSVL